MIDNLCSAGFADYFQKAHPGERLPSVSPMQLQICEEWLSRHLEQGDYPLSSIIIKEQAEHDTGQYRSAGAIIAVCISLGYRVERIADSPHSLIYCQALKRTAMKKIYKPNRIAGSAYKSRDTGV